MKKKVELFLGRPKDRSFDAFKEFIEGLSDHLGIPPERKASEEELRGGWQRFWKDK